MKNIWLVLKINIMGKYKQNSLLKSNEENVAAKGVMLLTCFILAMMGMYLFYEKIANVAQVNLGIESVQIVLNLSLILMTIIAFITSLFTAPSYLFASKDFEMLSSLPIEMDKILISKVIKLYIWTLMISATALVPGLICFGKFTEQGTLYYIYCIVVFLISPIIPMSVGIVFTILIGRLKKGFKNAKLFVDIFYIVLLSVIFMFRGFSNIILYEKIESIFRIANRLGFYFPGKLLLDVLVNLDDVKIIISIVVNVLVTIAVFLILKQNFVEINELSKDVSKSNHKKFDIAEIDILLVKDLKAYFSSPFAMYTMFCVVGIMMYIVALKFFGLDDTMLVNSISAGENISITVLIATMFFIGSSCTTASAISREGRNIEILKTLPTKFENIAQSKIAMNHIIVTPVLIVIAVILRFAFKIDGSTILWFFAICNAYIFMSSNLGLVINLCIPEIDQENVTRKNMSVVVNFIAHVVIILLITSIWFYGFNNDIGISESGNAISNLRVVSSTVIVIIVSIMSIILWRKGEDWFLEVE